jgi:hypothetical protein
MNIQRALFAHGSPISQGASAALSRLAPAAATQAAPAAQAAPCICLAASAGREGLWSACARHAFWISQP